MNNNICSKKTWVLLEAIHTRVGKARYFRLNNFKNEREMRNKTIGWPAFRVKLHFCKKQHFCNFWRNFELNPLFPPIASFVPLGFDRDMGLDFKNISIVPGSSGEAKKKICRSGLKVDLGFVIIFFILSVWQRSIEKPWISSIYNNLAYFLSLNLNRRCLKEGGGVFIYDGK